ncbi:ABC-type Mn2+/Zn2+ transport system, permease component [Candidatus Scalindua japonica]|uniref:ABC-type Mn2+/Zn2+ transport system, permease component n=1 Tax=Candidatus Scalindua japonica TaxID=1284222 RepID=A0A286U3J6_9BACT|nr:metal ABC transporter permease [Candidatus Scalindua japonica]GAX62707.1 ABC-type Mn2+/Zn2+ transport system, permease component [Candidatus Scalindua japonica]
MDLLTEIFSERFIQVGLAASIILGGICAYLGVYLILKRIVFVGAALSQIAAVGVVIGHMIGHKIGLNFEALAFLFSILGVLFFWLPVSGGSITRESLIGFSYIFASALSILIIAKDPLAEVENLDLFSGNILFVSDFDLLLISIISGIIFIIHMIFRKEFIFVSFDQTTAQTLNIPARFYDFLIYFTLGIAISVGIRSAGMLFIFSSLVIPAMTGLILFQRLKWIFLASVLSIWFSSIIGIVVSYWFDFPTGPAISVTNALILLICLCIKRFLFRST